MWQAYSNEYRAERDVLHFSCQNPAAICFNFNQYIIIFIYCQRLVKQQFFFRQDSRPISAPHCREHCCRIRFNVFQFQKREY